MTYILMTRPEQDGRQTAQKLHAPVAFEPVLTIHPLVTTLSLDDSVTDLIITSSRVLELVQNIQKYRQRTLWCVGDITAAVAHKMGFEDIIAVDRSAQELLEKIIKDRKPEASFFVHLRGDKIHVDIADPLNRMGYFAEHIIVYQSQAIRALTPETIHLLKTEQVGLIPFYSQRTAEVFIDLVKRTFQKQEITSLFAPIHSLAHSPTIAEILKALPWKTIQVIHDLGPERINEQYHILLGTYPPTPDIGTDACLHIGSH
jgi:uroporphyrinogen-III synthase